MKLHLLTPVVGGIACGAGCKFCIAGMTPVNETISKAVSPNVDSYKRVCEYAKAHGTETVLLTGKGEPCNWPDHISEYLAYTKPFGFRQIELQTNGIRIADRRPITKAHLVKWKDNGLDLIAISVTHYESEFNRKTYTPTRRSYIDLPLLIEDLHHLGFAVRLACIMHIGQIDSVESLEKLIDYARVHGVEQLTVRPVNKPENSRDDAVSKFVNAHALPTDREIAMSQYLHSRGIVVQQFSWGAKVFNISGQNVCMTNSLTDGEAGNEIHRQLIFFPNGTVSSAWDELPKQLYEFDPSVIA